MRGVRHVPFTGAVPPSRDEFDERFDRAGLAGRWWSNGPGDIFDWHEHSYDKILFCSAGSIELHLRDGDVTLRPGDRLDIERGVEHAAIVGPSGTTCVEAAVEDDSIEQV